MEQFVLSTENQEERIGRFIECLQNSSLQDYKHFVNLLYKTKQELLITKLVTSCKGKFYRLRVLNYLDLVKKYPREGKASYNLNFYLNIFVDAELHVNVIPAGKEDSGLDKVCRIPNLYNAIHIINTYI